LINSKWPPPVVSIVGKSGAGKTTLLEKLIPRLKHLGVRVGTIKHDVHGFEMDKPGKDSWRHKKAGADISVISSPFRIGMVRDVDHDFTLDELALLFPGVHLILTEGYKRGNRPKVEIFRPEVHDEPLCIQDESLLALVSDVPIDLGVPRFGLEDMSGLSEFLIRRFRLSESDPL
jgi:molybdopterin-guanine dinucleotide biosynthesis adapter protein